MCRFLKAVIFAVLELRFATTIIPRTQRAVCSWLASDDCIFAVADLDAMVPFVYPSALILVTSLCGVGITLLIWVGCALSFTNLNSVKVLWRSRLATTTSDGGGDADRALVACRAVRT